MGTLDCHALDHIAESLRHVGGLEYLHGGQLENSHELFKWSYHLKFEINLSSMDETIAQQTHTHLDRTLWRGTTKKC